MLVSAIHEHESVIGINTCPLPLVPTSHLPSPHPLGCHRAPALDSFPALCSRFPLAICFTHGSVRVSVLFSQIIPPFLPHCVQICSSCLCLLCCPACRIVTIIFLDSVYNGILLSYKKEHIWVRSNEVDEHRAYVTEWSKSERERQISYINAYIWNLFQIFKDSPYCAS